MFALTNEKYEKKEYWQDLDAKLALSDCVVLNLRGNVDEDTEIIFKLFYLKFCLVLYLYTAFSVLTLYKC